LLLYGDSMNRKFLFFIFVFCITSGYISACRPVEADNIDLKKVQNSPEEIVQFCQNDLNFESLSQEEDSLNHSPEPSLMIVSDWNQIRLLKIFCWNR